MTGADAHTHSCSRISRTDADVLTLFCDMALKSSFVIMNLAMRWYEWNRKCVSQNQGGFTVLPPRIEAERERIIPFSWKSIIKGPSIFPIWCNSLWPVSYAELSSVEDIRTIKDPVWIRQTAHVPFIYHNSQWDAHQGLENSDVHTRRTNYSSFSDVEPLHFCLHRKCKCSFTDGWLVWCK